MSSVVISGDSSGTVTLQAPSVAGSTILTLPATTGTVLTTSSSIVLISTVTASGTTVSFTGLSGYDKYMVIYSGINQGTSLGNLRFVYGTGATPTYVTSGYYTYGVYVATGGAATADRNDNAAYGYVNGGTAGGYNPVGTSGKIYFENFTSGKDTAHQSQSFQQTAAASWSYQSVSGALVNNATAKTAIQFSNNSGVSFAGGTFSLYGIAA